MKLDEVRMVSASGILGYGFPESSLKAGLARKPHMIGVDGGSSDPGPHYLGSGKAFTNRLSIKRDLSLLRARRAGEQDPDDDRHLRRRRRRAASADVRRAPARNRSANTICISSWR